MTRSRNAAALLVVALAISCTGGSGGIASPSTGEPMVPRGGTLRVVTTGFWPDTLDPKEFDGQTWEILRCCLLRTLLSYNGRPTDRGGTLLRPDLATGLPDVSPDGLTWTFHLKEGIRYAPPLQNTEIVAQDFERALLRAADPRANPSAYYGTYSFYYSVIQGFDAVARGRSQTISGLSTPDDHTLVVRLKAPTGDLGYRFAFPAVAPIPANPTDPSARLGVAQGHDDGYTQFLVSSGPYMVDGAAKLDFTQAAASQAPVVGLDLGRETPEALIPGSLTLVRDPSWVASSDDLRPAYPDRIEIQLGPAKLGPHPPPYPRIVARLFREVGDGRWDVVLGTDPPLGIVDRAASDPAIASRLHTEQVAIPDFISMNLAVPPFDDVHVRRAFSLALDKAALVSRANNLRDVSPSFRGVAARHLAPDALEGGLLSSWRPSWDVAPDGGDIAAAEAEMRRSRYDVDGDGLCDGAACDHAAFVVDDAYPATLLSPMRDALEAIGIRFNLRRVPRGGGGRGPADHVAVTADRWFNDFPAGSAFFPENFSGRAFTSPTNVDWDPSLLGASTEQLRAWGYAVSQVPAVDTSIDRCDALAGQQQVQCWASLDQHLMENVVPWIPFMFQTSTAMVSSRVVQYSFDQSTEQPALDQLAVGSG